MGLREEEISSSNSCALSLRSAQAGSPSNVTHTWSFSLAAIFGVRHRYHSQFLCRKLGTGNISNFFKSLECGKTHTQGSRAQAVTPMKMKEI